MILQFLINIVRAHALAAEVVYIIIAMCFIYFYGRYAIYIFIGHQEIRYKREQSCSWRIHQCWANALGQAIGWSVGYYVCKKVIALGLGEFTTLDYLALIITFLGVSGHLPTVLTKWKPKS